MIDARALFSLGFRPFFLSAAAFAVVSMAVWAVQWVGRIDVLPGGVPPMYWHAHEMIYGYALAVIAGFLLTAVRNWTGIRTLHGPRLLALLLLWLSARVASLLPGAPAEGIGLVLDGAFILFLSVAVTVPVVRARQWRNMGVISKVYVFLIGNVLFALGWLGRLPDGERMGIAIGVYMVISLIFVLARRVMPMFIERGVGYSVTLRNRVWVDVGCFVLFLLFAVTDVFFDAPGLTAGLAAALLLLHGVRLWGWHTPGIWKKPLLWVLFVGYGWMLVGFALKTAAYLFGVSPFLAVHAFAAGGIGMMTLGMMARVSLGHTGRDVGRPPPALSRIFALLGLGAVVRVLPPLMFPDHPLVWIGMAQVFWVAAFLGFLLLYAPMLVQPRVDGRPI